MPVDELSYVIEQKVAENPALSLVTHAEKRDFLVGDVEKKPSLYEKILEQARDEFSGEEMDVVDLIAGNLNAKGFLEEDVSEVCNVAQNVAESILRRFQLLDPIGIGSKNAREALLVQARHKKLRCAEVILQDHYDLLIKQKYKEIARELEITVEEVLQIIDREIKMLNPFPGLGYEVGEAFVKRPEMKITHSGSEWVVTHVLEDLPELKIDENMLERHFVKDAHQLIDALMKRKALLTKMVLFIADRQKEYLLENSKELKPLVQKEIAEALDISLSTVSRALSNKVIETPLGIIDLKSLLSHEVCEGSSKQKAMDLLKKLLSESQKKSDQKLSEILESEHNIKLSRRTVAKYRKQMEC